MPVEQGSKQSPTAVKTSPTHASSQESSSQQRVIPKRLVRRLFTESGPDKNNPNGSQQQIRLHQEDPLDHVAAAFEVAALGNQGFLEILLDPRIPSEVRKKAALFKEIFELYSAQAIAEYEHTVLNKHITCIEAFVKNKFNAIQDFYRLLKFYKAKQAAVGQDVSPRTFTLQKEIYNLSIKLKGIYQTIAPKDAIDLDQITETDSLFTKSISKLVLELKDALEKAEEEYLLSYQDRVEARLSSFDIEPTSPVITSIEADKYSQDIKDKNFEYLDKDSPIIKDFKQRVLDNLSDKFLRQLESKLTTVIKAKLIAEGNGDTDAQEQIELPGQQHRDFKTSLLLELKDKLLKDINRELLREIKPILAEGGVTSVTESFKERFIEEYLAHLTLELERQIIKIISKKFSQKLVEITVQDMAQKIKVLRDKYIYAIDDVRYVPILLKRLQRELNIMVKNVEFYMDAKTQPSTLLGDIDAKYTQRLERKQKLIEKFIKDPELMPEQYRPYARRPKVLEDILMKANVSVNVTDKNGNSLLHIAAKFKRMSIAGLLFTLEINPKITNLYKQTASQEIGISDNAKFKSLVEQHKTREESEFRKKIRAILQEYRSQTKNSPPVQRHLQRSLFSQDEAEKLADDISQYLAQTRGDLGDDYLVVLIDHRCRQQKKVNLLSNLNHYNKMVNQFTVEVLKYKGEPDYGDKVDRILKDFLITTNVETQHQLDAANQLLLEKDSQIQSRDEQIEQLTEQVKQLEQEKLTLIQKLEVKENIAVGPSSPSLRSPISPPHERKSGNTLPKGYTWSITKKSPPPSPTKKNNPLSANPQACNSSVEQPIAPRQAALVK